MYINAEITGVPRLAYVLPDDAIVSHEGKQYIFFNEGENKFFMQEIRTGINDNSKIEVTEVNFLLGKSIVQSGSYTLLMALKNKSEE